MNVAAIIFLCIVGVASTAHGQESTDCTQQAFDEAETSYRMRWRGSELKIRAERQLKALVQNCTATPERDQAQEQLQIVQEELAESNLQIAKFYLDKSRVSNSRRTAARARLKTVIENYAKYSKRDEVLLILGQLNLDAGDLEEATVYYRRLINDFPYSQYAGEASLQLSVIDMIRVNQKP